MVWSSSASAHVDLPATVEQAWSVLSDTPRMIAIDPLLDTYEPENGVIEQGTLNRVTSRLGPLRVSLTTRTELLAPPHRAVFVSVSPARPIRIRADDRLEATSGGCRYTVTSTATPTLPVVGHVAAWLVPRVMARSRRRFMQRLRAAVTAG